MISVVLPKLDESQDSDIREILKYLEYAHKEGMESEIYQKCLEKACKIQGKKIRDFCDLMSSDTYAFLLEKKYIDDSDN